MKASVQYVPSTSGVEVALHDLGGAGPPLLFLHATGFHGRCYEPVAEALGDSFHCFGADLRGHGDSRYPDGVDLSWAEMAQDLLAAKSALSPDAPIFGVGHSMGGAALLLAERLAPGTFRSAWAFEPVVFPSRLIEPGESALVRSARKRREVFESLEAVIERYRSRPPFDRVDPRALRAYVEHGFRPYRSTDGTEGTDGDHGDDAVILKCRGEIEAQIFENSDNGVFDHLGEIELSTAVCVSGDGGAPAKIGKPVAERMPNASLLRFDDLSHFGPFEDPERIAKSIISWFQTAR